MNHLHAKKLTKNTILKYYVGNSKFVGLQIDSICDKSDKNNNILSKPISGAKSSKTAKREIHKSGTIKLGHLEQTFLRTVAPFFENYFLNHCSKAHSVFPPVPAPAKAMF